jgi:hypothetical protein
LSSEKEKKMTIRLDIETWLIPVTAWMIAAFLPLPPNPMREMRERDNSTSNLDSSNDAVNEYARHVRPMDEARYESARWWRQLNRIMSFLGLLIIGTIVRIPHFVFCITKG